MEDGSTLVTSRTSPRSTILLWRKHYALGTLARCDPRPKSVDVCQQSLLSGEGTAPSGPSGASAAHRRKPIGGHARPLHAGFVLSRSDLDRPTHGARSRETRIGSSGGRDRECSSRAGRLNVLILNEQLVRKAEVLMARYRQCEAQRAGARPASAPPQVWCSRGAARPPAGWWASSTPTKQSPPLSPPQVWCSRGAARPPAGWWASCCCGISVRR
eukprot:9503923-Pyramimonas_sp.AAC.1